MKIFIIGGTGFIGRHTVKLLSAKGHELMMLVHNKKRDLDNLFNNLGLGKQIKTVYGGLSDMVKLKGQLKEFKPDTVLHLAWEGLPDYGMEMCLLNLYYGLNLFKVAGESGIKCIVSVGSCWEYAKRHGRLTEDSQIEYSKMFPAVKNSLRIMGEAIAKEYCARFYWPRLFFVYGPGQRNTSLIPSIINSVRMGDKLVIKNPSDRNDFIFVLDAVQAIVNIIEEKPDKVVYNVGSGYSTCVSEIISLVYDAMGSKMDYVFKKSQTSDHMRDDFWADITAIQNDVGWSPKYSLVEGIKATVEYYAK